MLCDLKAIDYWFHLVSVGLVFPLLLSNLLFTYSKPLVGTFNSLSVKCS